jgi:methylated-DNA-[protein]-cysteine S-methyltransferase
VDEHVGLGFVPGIFGDDLWDRILHLPIVARAGAGSSSGLSTSASSSGILHSGFRPCLASWGGASLTFPSHGLSYPPVKSSRPDTVRSCSCRLGPDWVTVNAQRGKVTRVSLGSKGAGDDRNLARDLESVLRGGRIPRLLHVDTTGLTDFTRKVLGRCAAIGPGQVMTYSELATSVGRPMAARAVGQVMANNQFPLLIPCHRVVGAGRRLTGFGGGVAMKERLLAHEGWKFEGKGRSRRLVERSQKPDTRNQNAEVPVNSRRKGSGAGARSG